MWDRFSLRLWAARFFFLFVLLFPKRRSADRRDEACRLGFGFPWSDVVFQSDPPTTFAAFDATIPIAEPTVRATVWIVVSSVPPGWSPSGDQRLVVLSIHRHFPHSGRGITYWIASAASASVSSRRMSPDLRAKTERMTSQHSDIL